MTRFLPLLALATVLSGCISGSPSPAVPDEPLLPAKISLSNDGTKELRFRLNVTMEPRQGHASQTYVLQEEGRVEPGRTLERSFPLLRANYTANVSWHAKGEEVTAAGQPVVRDEFSIFRELSFDASRCGPTFQVDIRFTARYEDAQAGPANPALRHGLRDDLAFDLCP